jgi:hypothetical protein
MSEKKQADEKTTDKATENTQVADDFADDANRWIIDAQLQQARDSRTQPWKQTFGCNVDSGFCGEDKVTSRGEGDVQHSSVAA